MKTLKKKNKKLSKKKYKGGGNVNIPAFVDLEENGIVTANTYVPGEYVKLTDNANRVFYNNINKKKKGKSKKGISATTRSETDPHFFENLIGRMMGLERGVVEVYWNYPHDGSIAHFKSYHFIGPRDKIKNSIKNYLGFGKKKELRYLTPEEREIGRNLRIIRNDN